MENFTRTLVADTKLATWKLKDASTKGEDSQKASHVSISGKEFVLDETVSPTVFYQAWCEDRCYSRVSAWEALPFTGFATPNTPSDRVKLDKALHFAHLHHLATFLIFFFISR